MISIIFPVHARGFIDCTSERQSRATGKADSLTPFADRVNYTEEVVRLESHIAQFRQIMAAGEPSGRKLDFLIQEFNRETNTIGSKANSKDAAQLVVDMKSEIEKIREQVQNIE